MLSISSRSTETWLRHFAISASESMPGEYFSHSSNNPLMIDSAFYDDTAEIGCEFLRYDLVLTDNAE